MKEYMDVVEILAWDIESNDFKVVAWFYADAKEDIGIFLSKIPEHIRQNWYDIRTIPGIEWREASLENKMNDIAFPTTPIKKYNKFLAERYNRYAAELCEIQGVEPYTLESFLKSFWGDRFSERFPDGNILD